MRAVGDKKKRTIRPDFDHSISIDFQGAKITSDTGFLVMREIDQRFNILGTAASQIDDKWKKPRRVVCKIEWHAGELFPRVGFIVTNSNVEAEQVITIYNGRAEIENRIKEGKNTLRWDKTSCHRFAANQARLLVGCLAYNLLHMIRDAAFWAEGVKPSIESIIRRLVKVGTKVVYHARRWYVHVASAFPLARYYRILFA